MSWKKEVNTNSGYVSYDTIEGCVSPLSAVITQADIFITTAGVTIFNKYYSNLPFIGSFSFFNDNSDNAKTFFLNKISNGALLNYSQYARIPNPSNVGHTIFSVKMGNCYMVMLAYESASAYVSVQTCYVKDLLREYSNQYVRDAKRCYIYGQTSFEISRDGYERKYVVVPCDCVVQNGIYEGQTFTGAVTVGVTTRANNPDYFLGATSLTSLMVNDTSIFGDFEDTREISDEYGSESSGGGYGGGSFDDSSDSFGLPSLPSLGVSEVGFINVYNPSKGQLQGFADELFPNFEMPTPSTSTGIEAVAENLANTFEVLGDFAESYVNAGLINYVIDCHIVPVAPTTNGTSKIKVGFKTFNYTPAKVTSDYVEFDCGTLEIAEYYQNFLDYEGTKAKLYLPFIGFVDIKPEWFQSGKLGVTYHFNIIDGSCIAFVIATSSKSKLNNTVVATFGGNCCVHMPITGVNYSSMISGVVGGAVGIASNASNMIKTNRTDKGTVMSNIEGATGIASNLADVVGAKPSIEQSNGYNAGMSFMCYRRPYLLIERPVASFSKNYPSEQGLPLNVTKKLGSMKGFTTCTAPVVDNFHCLEEEKEMIKQALIEGTIF